MKTSANIRYISNWGYWFELDDKTPLDNRAVRVLWPDGSVSDAVLRVIGGTYHYSDHGHSGTGANDWLALETSVNGAIARVRWPDRVESLKPVSPITFTFLD